MKPTPIQLQPPGLAVNRDACFSPDEKIGIVRIRLSLPRCGMSAVVSEFTDADRRLTAWRQARHLSDTCHFSILFTDGTAIRGSFGLSDKAKTLVSLPRIVRMALGVGPLLRGYTAHCVLVDKGGSPLASTRLDGYAVNQTMPPTKARHASMTVEA